MSLKHDLNYVVEIAREAGAVVREKYGHVERLTKTNSATTDETVTEADRASQALIVRKLKERFTTDGIIGEESETGTTITAEITDPLGRNWVIDPIDGTNNFVAGLGCFAVCIGLLDAGMPVLGVVYDVTRDEMYSAATGFGAFRNHVAIRALPTPMNDGSLLMMTSNLVKSDGGCYRWAERWIGQTQWKTRILGSAALEAVAVAAGVAHGAVTVNGKLWDAVAPAAIVREAGGRVTDLAGKEIFPFDLTNYQGKKVPFLAAGPAAQGTLLQELACA